MSLDTQTKRLTVSTTLLKAARRWRYASRRCLGPLALSEACAEPLLLARRLGEPVHQSTLAQMAGLKGPALTRLLDQLVAADLMQRLRDSDDRRTNSVFLTEKGLLMADSVETRLAELRERALSKVSDHDLETTLKVLRAFLDVEWVRR